MSVVYWYDLGARRAQPPVAIDCIGVVILGLNALDFGIPEESNYKSEGEFIRLVRFMLKISDKIGSSWNCAEPGDLIVFGTNEYNNHVAVMGYNGNIIHASSDPAYLVCLEEPMTGTWKMAVHSVYRIKGLKDV